MPVMTLKPKNLSNYMLQSFTQLCQLCKNLISSNGKTIIEEDPNMAVLNIIKYVLQKEDIQELSKRDYLATTNSFFKMMQINLHTDIKRELLDHAATYKKTHYKTN